MFFLFSWSCIICPAQVKWSAQTGSDNNRQYNQPCHQDMASWPQQCWDAMRQQGLSQKKKKKRFFFFKGGGSWQMRRWKTKNTRGENRKQKKKKKRGVDKTEEGEAGWKIGRCTTGWWNRARKAKRERSGTASQTIVKQRNKKKDTKGKGDKLRRGHGGDGQRQGEPKYKDNVRFNTSLKREKN